ncbi:hypothetical protein JRO89_XS12G0243000 [Xanthoceras sorbifolium]|uniref:Uncharacterized protein n=1 Tax=Xanthoceras sorbifolium TaxID=99658 RepID=A0ABQ8HDQ1_9ROSI|nr:hypothetical protein JRO89_XS12G0243000 [Xanthoceras sorbifolium]
MMRAAEEQSFTVQDGQSVMQVVSLRGSNLIEVMDSQGEKSLALFPAKFQKSLWIKRVLLRYAFYCSVFGKTGNAILLKIMEAGEKHCFTKWSFVVVDKSGKEKALKDGSKVVCIVTKVLFYEQVRALQKSSECKY